MRMRMDFSLQQRPELRMKLAPQIIQSIEILQLPTLELQQRLKAELLENPVLEMQEPGLEEEEEETSTEDAPHEERSPSEAEFEKMEDIEQSWREFSHQTARRVGGSEEADRKFEAMQNTAARPISLQDYLFDQFHLLDQPAELLPVAENLIYNIDDNGYLKYGLDEIIESMEKPCTRERAQRALELIQSLDPPGIGARDLKECLLLQIRSEGVEECGSMGVEEAESSTPTLPHSHTPPLPHSSTPPLLHSSTPPLPHSRTLDVARLLITEHLDDLQNNRMPKIAKETGRSMEDIKDAVAFISHLNPRPGAAFSAAVSPYVIPDVVVELIDGEYLVTLQDDRLPRVYINTAYSRLLRDKRTTDTAKDYIRKRIQAARWLLDSIEQRRHTLSKISRAIVDVQRDFLEHGIAHLHPLKMETIAQTTHVHVSTVCRAIADKYMQTPRGIYPLKFFFTGGTRATDGTLHSRKSVKERVREVIEAEDKANPLSDEQVAAALQAEGLDIARRTVTKYRKAMAIPSTRQRKQY
jgi:RNA polymerase sigma-54 factor